MENEKLTLKELSEKVIREIHKPLTPKEIWDIAKEKGYDKLSGTMGKTPWNTIGAHIYVDMRDNKDSIFIKLGSMPRRFYLKNLPSINDEDVNKIKLENKALNLDNVKNYKEKDLHQFLTYYVHTFKLIYTKTINHEKSKKSGYTQWLHPDLVGILYHFEDYNEKAFDIAKEIGSIPIELYSFEIKKELNFNNIRESFFQAVSNSSWANEGYLAAASISDDDEFYSELERLSSSFGIGIIQLNIDEPDSSDIIFSAKYKTNLDWKTISKLSETNSDFEDFLDKAIKAMKIKEINKDAYDKVSEKQELLKNIT
ncbi:MAG: HTH domain-containing protein [bacterium]